MLRAINMYHCIKNEFALNEAHLQMRLFIKKSQQIRSQQDNEAPHVLSVAQEVASKHFRLTKEISQNPATFNS